MVVALLSDQTIFTASFEAKSSRTFRNIRPDYLDKKWITHSLLIGVVVTAISVFFGWVLTDHWFLKWIFPFIVFVVTGVLFLALTSDNKFYRPIDVISQAKGYPGNEQWIALSTDAFYKLSTDKQNSLIKDCRSASLGLIRISAGPKVKILQVPKVNMKNNTDYLACYSKGRKLRKRLEIESQKVEHDDVLKSN